MHLAVTGDWPDEAAPLQAFGEEAQSVTVSPQHFYRKRKLTAVCSHQTRIGNLDAHLI
ncbi:hypothetical protein AD05_5492 [Escherichia coli 5-366-08_S4_C2]|nr:hypothetical protein AD05_5492 [Escherichia coli 5-366-08_S4_C2]